MNPRARHRRLPLGVVTVLTLGARSTQPATQASGDMPEAWRAEVEQILALDLTDFEREVLQDYTITDQEITAAQDEFRRCLKKKDDRFEVTFGEDGSTELGAKPESPVALEGEEWDRYSEELFSCSAGTTDNIFFVYYGMLQDPENRSFPEIVRDCFEKYDVPDGRELSPDEFERMIFPDGEDLYAPSTPDGQACMDDPHGRLG